MQKNTKKRAAIISAAVVIGFFALYLALPLFAVVSQSLGDIIGMLFLVFYGGIIALIIWGVCHALRQRLREIEGGEEEDAKQY